MSLSARRAWIEIKACITTTTICTVALRKESVDRNFYDVSLDYKEVLSLSARRAWIEIIVYRLNCHLTESLSARRAWIEINSLLTSVVSSAVALRKESVDRNFIFLILSYEKAASLSARRAWIEITRRTYQQGEERVALRKESVDRNI